MEKNMRIVMIVVAVITLILVISLVSVITINLNNSNDSDVFNEDSYNLTDDEVSLLISLTSIYDSYLITFDGTKNISDLSDLEKINFIDRLPFEVKQELDLDFDSGVSLKRIEDILKKYFGKDITFSPVNAVCFLDDGDSLIYDSNTKMYKENSDYHAHGAYMPLSIENYYVEGKRIVDNDKLVYIITLKKAMALPNTSIYYGNYTDLVNERNVVVDLYEENKDYENENVNDLIEPYKDELTSYTYVFETRDSINNSYLTHFDKIDNKDV